MKKINIIFLSSLLLNSCTTKPSQVNSIAAIAGGVQEPIKPEEIKENDSKILSITFPIKQEKGDATLKPSLALCPVEQNKEPEGRNGFIFNGIDLPEEVILQVFSHLPVKDIAQAAQVCKGWQQLSEDSSLWRAVRAHIHGDYLTSEATKEQAKLHTLRVYVHTLTDLTRMEKLIAKYNLNKYRRFIHYQSFIYELLDKSMRRSVIEEQAIQGNEMAIELKIQGLVNGKHGCNKDKASVFIYNESLVAQGNLAAIQRKVDGLANGFYRYMKNPESAFTYNEHLINQGNEQAIERKLLELTYGGSLYKRNAEAAFSFNEHLVGQGNYKAIEQKVWGITNGVYGYEKDLETAFNLNEFLVAQGRAKAVERKVEGLVYGDYGYEEDLEVAVTYNEELINQNNEEAVIRKIRSLGNIKDMDDSALPLYKELPDLRSWIEGEAIKGTRWACYLKAKGLKYGILGFEKDHGAAVAFIKAYDVPY